MCGAGGCGGGWVGTGVGGGGKKEGGWGSSPGLENLLISKIMVFSCSVMSASLQPYEL